MRISIIVDETMVLLPQWMEGIITHLSPSDEIVSVTALPQLGNKTWEGYLKKHFWIIPPVQMVTCAWWIFLIHLRSYLFAFHFSKKPQSILQVVQKYHLPILSTKNVNDEFFLQKLKKIKPDVIISSCSQIFKQDVLKIPKIACINRHSSLLPAYGGVLPVFWALLYNEKECGVSMHTMTKKIDRGTIWAQRTISIKDEDSLVSLYQKSYIESVEATLEALKNLKNKKIPKKIRKTNPSYFRFPQIGNWQLFFKKGRRFI